MAASADDTAARLAACIRAERAARGWALAELAARADVAKATISKIERGDASPTAVVLVKLAGAFGLTLAGLLLRAEGGGGGRLSRAADQPVWRDPESGYRRRQVFADPEHPLELVEVELPPGARVTLPAASYARIRQVVWVSAGTLTLSSAGERHVLARGDCVGFGAPADTTFANDGKRPCRYAVALARS
jgi:transcriptional regulator with XRE-family HTH domain